ncbi:MAG: SGNH/GDSL hydrolase family protein [Bacteroidota bacterium]|nr:SGNH/GDSL hydrolase family protein [Bacteroidota bacterium]MDP4275963.1 SGNH/GDSL hydrolase family protein [Bacteroidota bacterium]
MKSINYLFSILLLSFFMGEMVQAQDWPNFNRYRDENAKISAPGSGEKRVVFMGNSITDFWSRVNPEFFAGKPYINRGISGQTSPQMLVRFRADVIKLRPSVVVILAGTNDIAGNTGPSTLEMIMDNISSMSELAKANGIKVVLCSVLPVYDYPWRKGLNPAEKIVSLNKMIKSYADTHACVYLDYYSSLVDSRKGMKSEYSKDGVHPNKEGYMVMGPLVEKAIAKALNAPKKGKKKN